jgi:hypothetical protein
VEIAAAVEIVFSSLDFHRCLENLEGFPQLPQARRLALNYNPESHLCLRTLSPMSPDIHGWERDFLVVGFELCNFGFEVQDLSDRPIFGFLPPPSSTARFPSRTISSCLIEVRLPFQALTNCFARR